MWFCCFPNCNRITHNFHQGTTSTPTIHISPAPISPGPSCSLPNFVSSPLSPHTYTTTNPPLSDHRRILMALHTSAGARINADQDPNKIFVLPPPLIDPSESFVPAIPMHFLPTPLRLLQLLRWRPSRHLLCRTAKPQTTQRHPPLLLCIQSHWTLNYLSLGQSAGGHRLSGRDPGNWAAAVTEATLEAS